MIYKRVDKYLKKKINIESKIFFSYTWFWSGAFSLRGADMMLAEDDEVEWDIIYDWLEEAVPV